MIYEEGMMSGVDERYIYNEIDLPFPVKNRDVVVKVNWTIDPSNGSLRCHCERIETGYNAKKNVVRMPHVLIDFILSPKGPEKTEITYIMLTDLAGYLPPFLVNMINKESGIKTVASLRLLAKKDKYLKADHVVTTTPLSVTGKKTCTKYYLMKWCSGRYIDTRTEYSAFFVKNQNYSKIYPGIICIFKCHKKNMFCFERVIKNMDEKLIDGILIAV